MKKQEFDEFVKKSYTNQINLRNFRELEKIKKESNRKYSHLEEDKEEQGIKEKMIFMSNDVFLGLLDDIYREFIAKD